MLDKLAEVERRFGELEEMLGDPDVIGNRSRFVSISKEHAGLTELMDVFRQFNGLDDEEAGLVLLQKDDEPEMREMAEAELPDLRRRKAELEQQLKILLLPTDPNDQRNVILEIRAGTGGDEAGLFVADLFRMYTRYAEERGWKVDIMDSSPTGLGGFKEIVSSIEGAGAFSRLKFEGGVHRVQRVPTTETQGRIHTSAVTVAVLPEADEVELNIEDKDLRVDVFRASGPGGQSVNTTDSAIRVTHLPTGMIVICQDEKSQHKNKAKALKVLRARLFERAQAEHDAAIAADRKAMVGTGDRSERIRTYNFPQNRVTDHRIGLTTHSLDRVIAGEADLVIEPLITFTQAEALKAID
jgi:peptide chain release factor 1